MFSKSEGAGLMVQEDERFLSNVVLEGRNTNPDDRRRKLTNPNRFKVYSQFKYILGSQ